MKNWSKYVCQISGTYVQIQIILPHHICFIFQGYDPRPKHINTLSNSGIINIFFLIWALVILLGRVLDIVVGVYSGRAYKPYQCFMTKRLLVIVPSLYVARSSLLGCLGRHTFNTQLVCVSLSQKYDRKNSIKASLSLLHKLTKSTQTFMIKFQVIYAKIFLKKIPTQFLYTS